MDFIKLLQIKKKKWKGNAAIKMTGDWRPRAMIEARSLLPFGDKRLKLVGMFLEGDTVVQCHAQKFVLAAQYIVLRVLLGP